MVKFCNCNAQATGIDLLSAGPRDASLDGVSRIVVTGRRGMTRRHEAIDQRLVLGGELVLERAPVVGPLRLRAWARHSPGHQRIIEHPRDGELAGRETARLGVAFDGLSNA